MDFFIMRLWNQYLPFYMHVLPFSKHTIINLMLRNTSFLLMKCKRQKEWLHFTTKNFDGCKINSYRNVFLYRDIRQPSWTCSSSFILLDATVCKCRKLKHWAFQTKAWFVQESGSIYHIMWWSGCESLGRGGASSEFHLRGQSAETFLHRFHRRFLNFKHDGKKQSGPPLLSRSAQLLWWIRSEKICFYHVYSNSYYVNFFEGLKHTGCSRFPCVFWCLSWKMKVWKKDMESWKMLSNEHCFGCWLWYMWREVK